MPVDPEGKALESVLESCMAFVDLPVEQISATDLPGLVVSFLSPTFVAIVSCVVN